MAEAQWNLAWNLAIEGIYCFSTLRSVVVIWAFGFAGSRCSTYLFRNLLSLLSLGFVSSVGFRCFLYNGNHGCRQPKFIVYQFSHPNEKKKEGLTLFWVVVTGLVALGPVWVIGWSMNQSPRFLEGGGCSEMLIGWWGGMYVCAGLFGATWIL